MKQGNEISNPETNTPEATQAQPNIPQQPVEGTAEQPPTEPTSPQKTGKKWLVPGLIGLVVIALGVAGYFVSQNIQLKKGQPSVAQPTQAPVATTTPKQEPSQITDVEDSLLVFEKDEKIFLLNGLSSEAVEIDEGNSPSLSSDQTKIAYVKMDKDNNIHIYDRVTGKKESITTDEWRLRGVEWSPDSKYLLTDSGTSPQGGGAIYEYPSGNKGSTFSTFGNLEWLNNSEFVFVEPQQVSPERPYGSGSGSGLSKVSIVSGAKQTLAQASGVDNYNLLETKNEIVYFSKTTVADNNDWGMQDKEVKTYWKMNADGTGKAEVGKPETFRDMVLATIPQQYSDYQLFSGPDRNDNFANWVVFDLNSGGSVYENLICIVDIENPQNTFRQITVGTYPTW